VTNLSTKSGTNSLHGEAYEYVRNKIFNANDFFSTLLEDPGRLGCKNQFGANAGGPLNFSRNGGRNKTFGFSAGKLPPATGQPFTATVPDAKEELAIF